MRWKTRVEDVSFRDDASGYVTEDYVQARQGVGVGAPLDARGARHGAGARHAIFWRVLHKRRPGEVYFRHDSSLARRQRRGRAD